MTGAWGWQTHHLHVPNVMKCGSLNLLEPFGPHRACYGTPLTLFISKSSYVTAHVLRSALSHIIKRRIICFSWTNEIRWLTRELQHHGITFTSPLSTVTPAPRRMQRSVTPLTPVTARSHRDQEPRPYSFDLIQGANTKNSEQKVLKYTVACGGSHEKK